MERLYRDLLLTKTLLAELALTASNGETSHDSIAHLDLLDIGSDCFYDAHTFVSQDVVLFQLQDIAVQEVLCGARGGVSACPRYCYILFVQASPCHFRTLSIQSP
jgi:hypothetical protein